MKDNTVKSLIGNSQSTTKILCFIKIAINGNLEITYQVQSDPQGISASLRSCQNVPQSLAHQGNLVA
jgi:hypothetical protein